VQSADGKRVHIQEVSARDGFQIEPIFVPTTRKNRLHQSPEPHRTRQDRGHVIHFPDGNSRRWRTRDRFERNSTCAAVEYSALVPNLRGCERALSSKVDEINLVMSASESTTSQICECTANNRWPSSRILCAARGIVAINASLSTAFGCPFEGHIEPSRVLELTGRFAQMGIERVSHSLEACYQILR